MSHCLISETVGLFPGLHFFNSLPMELFFIRALLLQQPSQLASWLQLQRDWPPWHTTAIIQSTATIHSITLWTLPSKVNAKLSLSFTAPQIPVTNQNAWWKSHPHKMTRDQTLSAWCSGSPSPFATTLPRNYLRNDSAQWWSVMRKHCQGHGQPVNDAELRLIARGRGEVWNVGGYYFDFWSYISFGSVPWAVTQTADRKTA